MRLNPRYILLAALVAAAVLVAGCTQGPATPAPAATPPPSPAPSSISFDAETVLNVNRLAQMWGHLEMSRAGANAGAADTAASHAKHPVDEYWDLMKGPLAKLGLEQKVRTALDRHSLAAANRSPDRAQGLDAAVSAIREAMQAQAGPDWGRPAFQGQVVRELLETVEEEYVEAVEGGNLTKLEEYQDSFGFFQVARQLYTPIAPAVRAGEAKAADEVEEEFGALGKVFAEVAPSKAPAPLSDVKNAVDEIRAELADALKLATGKAEGPKETVAKIRAMMKEALEEYGGGKKDKAYESASNAYLEGFEKLEGGMIQKGQRELVDGMEAQFKELRDGVRGGRPLAEMQALVVKIEDGLKRTLEILG